MATLRQRGREGERGEGFIKSSNLRVHHEKILIQKAKDYEKCFLWISKSQFLS